jgi:DNA helicase-2/ATP-dependent DNA helicase PcrA
MTWDLTVEASPQSAGRVRQRGTPQQESFWSECLDGSGNVVLEARAGTGKSTSCREAMWRILEARRSTSVRYCAFNRSIAGEFAAKAPPDADVGTFHSFCWRSLSQVVGAKEPTVDKSYLILDTVRGGKDLKGYHRRSISRLVGLAKNLAFDPSWSISERTQFLEDVVDLYDIEVYGPKERIVDYADDVLEASARETSLVDFDDMLWLTWLSEVAFPVADFLFVDECQDLNPIQHALIPRLNPRGRTVCVGDRFQSIYGFRGADVDSIPNLIEALEATVLPLTVTFRCPRSHVAYAREIVGDLEAHGGNSEGTIVRDLGGLPLDLRPGDAVICRSNAPLVKAALEAISRRVPATMRGRGFSDGLGSIARRLLGSTSIVEFTRAVNRWRDEKILSYADRDGQEDKIERVSDQAGALLAIAESCSSTGEIMPTITSLFDDEAPSASRVVFSSVHRAKGTEARRVVHLQTSGRRKSRRPPTPSEIQQSMNLEYVARTRSLDVLELVAAGGGL